MMKKAHKNSCKSFNSSKSDSINILPWCSSGKVSQRKLVPKCEIQSSYPLRENIWEYLHDGAKFKSGKRRKKLPKQKGNWKVKLVGVIAILFMAIAGLAYLWRINAEPTYSWMDKMISRTKLLSFDWKPSVSEECCHKMRYLALELSRAEKNLRTTRLRHVTQIQPDSSVDRRYIENAFATKGIDTAEWGSRVALWGIVPLWKASPPPDTVLSLRNPTPADCWPFSGSIGEVIIHLRKSQRISSISIEHVRPDVAKSAPKHFTVYGILGNNTLVKIMDNQYRRNGPAKQYYALGIHAVMSSIIFRVLSNHGNVKYTCIYRIHLYGNNDANDVL